MEPALGKNDIQMFYKYLDKTSGYFEYGSGGSTYQAAIRNNIRKIYSVENDPIWHNRLKNLLKDKTNIYFIYNEMDVKPNNFGNPGPKCTPAQQKIYSDNIIKLNNDNDKLKIAFIGGSNTVFDENIEGIGGSQLSFLHIAEYFAQTHDVSVVHSNRQEQFRGKSCILYVKKINEIEFDVLIDCRTVRNIFHKNVVHILWMEDCYLGKFGNKNKYNKNICKYDRVVSLTTIQQELWKRTMDTYNFVAINNPYFIEDIPKKSVYDKHKIIAFSSKTNWNKAIKIVSDLRKIDDRFTLHICSPSYKNISHRFNDCDFIINHGNLSHKNLMELLSDAFVCLYPTNFRESFGCVFYECMYYGVPMLTEYIENNGASLIIPKNLVLPSNTKADAYVDIISNWCENNTRPKIAWNHRNDEIYKQWEELIYTKKTHSIDLILINGRFRVACCLKCFNVINSGCLIAFNDFLRRPGYHVVLDYYDIVEKTIDQGMVILKKKENINSVPDNLIKKYESIKG